MSHAMLPLPSSTKVDGGDQLRRLVAIRRGSISRSGAPWLSASGFPAISRAMSTRGREQILDGEVLIPFVRAVDANCSSPSACGFTRFDQMAERNPPQVVRADQHCTHFIRELC